MIERIAAERCIDIDDVDGSAEIMSLGIDSLALIGIAGELAEFTGRELNAELLWEQRSVAGVARHLARPRSSSTATIAAVNRKTFPDASAEFDRESLVNVLRPGSGHRLLVCVGHYGIPPLLLAGLPPAIPVWWLRLDALYRPPFTLHPTDVVATTLFEHLQSVAAVSPVSLVGYSYGGAIAWELACLLDRAGWDVDLLLLEPAQFDHPELESLLEKLRRHMALLCGQNWTQRVDHLRSGANRLARRIRLKLFSNRILSRVRTGKPVDPQLAAKASESQIARANRGYVPSILRTGVTLAGRSPWLAAHQAKWEQACQWRPRIVTLEAAANHREVARLPAAQTWMEVIRETFSARSSGPGGYTASEPRRSQDSVTG